MTSMDGLAGDINSMSPMRGEVSKDTVYNRVHRHEDGTFIPLFYFLWEWSPSYFIMRAEV